MKVAALFALMTTAASAQILPCEPSRTIIAAPPIVQSGIPFRVRFCAAGATKIRFAESPNPDMSGATTTSTTELSRQLVRTATVPTPLYAQATAEDGPAVNVASAVVRTVVQPTPSAASPGPAVFRIAAVEGPQEAFTHPLASAASAPAIDNDAFTVSRDGANVIVRADVSQLPPGTTKGTLRIDETTSFPVSVAIGIDVAPRPRLYDGANVALIPAVSHAPGANDAEFRSDVRLTNPGANAAQYRFTFTPSRTDGTENGLSFSLPVGGNLTIALDDVLRNYFGAGALGESASGTLEIRPETAGATFLVASRTYNTTPNGTFGQFIPRCRARSSRAAESCRRFRTSRNTAARARTSASSKERAATRR